MLDEYIDTSVKICGTRNAVSTEAKGKRIDRR